MYDGKMKILLVDNGTSFLKQLVSLSETFGEVTVQSFGEVQPNAKADMLILSGATHCPYSATERSLRMS